MNLSAFCINRPAFTIVISLLLTILGIIGFINLPVRWIPNINPPQVFVQTSYPGANAKLVERDVTKIIEGRLSGINGIESISSSSSQNSSDIFIQFKLGQNMNVAVDDVRSSLERVRGELPKEAENPVISKANPNSDTILYITFHDDHRSERELSDYVDKYIVSTFETIDGVGRVNFIGKSISALQIKLDPAKMAGANITVEEVSQLLKEQSSAVPSGQLRGNDRYYSLVTNTGLNTADEFNHLILRNVNNQTLRLRDIGEAKLEADSPDSQFRIDGKPGVALGISTQSTANPLEVEKKVQVLFANLQRTLPHGMKAMILMNQADYIRASIWSVYESFAEAVLFVWIVILVFLGNFRATLIPIITIPVCIISTFAILSVLGFSINTITLMALVLAIGLVVDDAIVMLENITRHMEKGLSAHKASLVGSREILFSIVAMTLTLAAVYAPIAFTPGMLGLLFREFTFTLAGAVIISGIVALTLSPMMCARLLKPVKKESKYQVYQTRVLENLKSKYKKLLLILLPKRKYIVIFLILVSCLGLGTYYLIPQELAPVEDMNKIFVSMSAPSGASFQYTDKYVQQVEEIFAKSSDIESYVTISGHGVGAANSAFDVLILKPHNERKHTTKEIIDILQGQTSQISGLRTYIFTPPPPLTQFASGNEGQSLGMVLQTSSDYKNLQSTSQKIVDELKKDSRFSYVSHLLTWDNEQFEINIDRERATDLKVSLPSITNTISSLIAGRTIGKTENENILLKVQDDYLSDPNILQRLYVRNTDNVILPLSSLITMKVTTSPQRFEHADRLRSDTIYAHLAPNIKVSEGLAIIEKVAKDYVEDTIKITFTGEAKSFLESSGKTLFTFLLALIFIYLVLVAQFESFSDPLIIMLTVPFAIVGALLTLKLFGGTLNIYSNIGLITLIGLIAKHGILITDFANTLRMKGLSIHDAIVEASVLRLRPILMTTAAMALGALPLALAFGPGSESRQQVGLVVTGGLLFGTLFSLIVIPITYSFLGKFRKISPHVSTNISLQEKE